MTTLLFFHIAAAISLFIAIGLEWLMLAGLKTVRDVQGLRSVTAYAPVIAKQAPLSVVVLLAMGISMVAKSKEFAFGDAWVVTALVLVVIVATEASLVHGKRMENLAHAAKEAPDGPLTHDLLAKVNDPVMQISAFTASFMAVGAVWIMTHQDGWAGTIAAMLVATALGAVIGVLVSRRQVLPASSIAGQRQAPLSETALPPKARSRSSVD